MQVRHTEQSALQPTQFLTKTRDICHMCAISPKWFCFVPTVLGSASFLQRLLGFVVHPPPPGSSMFGTTGEVLFDDVTWK